MRRGTTGEVGEVTLIPRIEDGEPAAHIYQSTGSGSHLRIAILLPRFPLSDPRDVPNARVDVPDDTFKALPCTSSDADWACIGVNLLPGREIQQIHCLI